MKSMFLYLFALICMVLPANAETIQVVYTEYPPFTYTQNDTPYGFAIEILKKIIHIAELDTVIKSCPWKRAEKMLENNNNTLAFLSRNEKRENKYKWIGPIYPRTLSLYKLKSRSDIQIVNVEDIIKFKIGVVRGFASVNELLKFGIPKNNLEYVHHDTLNINKLFAKRIDLITNNDIVLAHLLRQKNHNLNELEKVIMVVEEGKNFFYFGLNKDTAANIEQKLKQAFDQIKNEGIYDNILQKYLK